MSVAEWSKVWFWGRSLDGIVDSYPVGRMDVSLSLSFECCVLLGRVLSGEMITLPEDS